MIFVITGTEAYPFDRLVENIDFLKGNGTIENSVYIQLGSCNYRPLHCRYDKWLSFDEVTENIKNADLVITHAGAGTTLLCLELGKYPIIVTRKKEFGEHLDDHQVSFAKCIERLKLVTAVYDVDKLGDQINHAFIKNQKAGSFYKNNNEIINYLNFWINSI